MGITLTDRARQYLGLFEEKTGVAPRDCVVDEEYGRLLFVVAPEDMRDAIGPDGRSIKRVEAALDKDVKVVEDADNPADFVASALAPAAVYSVAVEERDDDTRKAVADVDDADTGAAIGKEGRNIEAARQLASRHFDIDDIELA